MADDSDRGDIKEKVPDEEMSDALLEQITGGLNGYVNMCVSCGSRIAVYQMNVCASCFRKRNAAD